MAYDQVYPFLSPVTHIQCSIRTRSTRQCSRVQSANGHSARNSPLMTTIEVPLHIQTASSAEGGFWMLSDAKRCPLPRLPIFLSY
jgi:hypothetical protein